MQQIRSPSLTDFALAYWEHVHIPEKQKKPIFNQYEAPMGNLLKQSISLISSQSDFGVACQKEPRRRIQSTSQNTDDQQYHTRPSRIKRKRQALLLSVQCPSGSFSGRKRNSGQPLVLEQRKIEVSGPLLSKFPRSTMFTQTVKVSC